MSTIHEDAVIALAIAEGAAYLRESEAARRTGQPTGGTTEMAQLIRPNGSETLREPAQGESFTLEELQALVGGYIEIVRRLPDGQLMVVDEEGRMKGKPPNGVASRLAGQFIVGDTLILDDKEMGE